jgi:hypothetical protein
MEKSPRELDRMERIIQEAQMHVTVKEYGFMGSLRGAQMIRTRLVAEIRQAMRFTRMGGHPPCWGMLNRFLNEVEAREGGGTIGARSCESRCLQECEQELDDR